MTSNSTRVFHCCIASSHTVKRLHCFFTHREALASWYLGISWHTFMRCRRITSMTCRHTFDTHWHTFMILRVWTHRCSSLTRPIIFWRKLPSTGKVCMSTSCARTACRHLVTLSGTGKVFYRQGLWKTLRHGLWKVVRQGLWKARRPGRRWRLFRETMETLSSDNEDSFVRRCWHIVRSAFMLDATCIHVACNVAFMLDAAVHWCCMQGNACCLTTPPCSMVQCGAACCSVL